MNDHLIDRGLVAETLELAESTLREGDDLAPLLVVERWGEREAERFGEGQLYEAKARLSELISSGAGNETYALAYLDRADDDQPAIVIERGLPGQPEAKTFVQRFRPRRGALRRFKRIGGLESVDESEARRQASAPA